MNEVEVIKGVGGEATTGVRPYMVKVNGEILRDKRGIGRRFGDSFKAVFAGAREVDRLRAACRTCSGTKTISYMDSDESIKHEECPDCIVPSVPSDSAVVSCKHGHLPPCTECLREKRVDELEAEVARLRDVNKDLLVALECVFTGIPTGPYLEQAQAAISKARAVGNSGASPAFDRSQHASDCHLKAGGPKCTCSTGNNSSPQL